MTGLNAGQPFVLATQSILLLMETGTLNPDDPGMGVSFGERQLRAVGSSSRLSFGSLASTMGRQGRQKSSRGTVNIKGMVGRGGKCC